PQPQVALAVCGLCMQASTLVWLGGAALGTATATRVANALGQGDAAGARRLSYTSLGLVLASQLLSTARTWCSPPSCAVRAGSGWAPAAAWRAGGGWGCRWPTTWPCRPAWACGGCERGSRSPRRCRRG
ncbi:hypothetical protein Agub_g15687, partial [Astrephomene gubernaculifera]